MPTAARSVIRACLALFLVFGGVSSAAAEVVLHRGNTNEPNTLDPHRTSGTWESHILRDLFLGLTSFDAHGATIPGAAERWDVSADGKVYVFHLRRGLLWSDGVPFTADDVVFSIRRLLDPKTASDYASNFYILVNGREANTGKLPLDQVGARALDALTVEMRLHTPVPYLLELLTHVSTYPVPRHVVERYGREWARPGRMASSGAYMADAWEPQTYVRAVKNPRFYDAKTVAIDTIYYYPLEDQQTALKQFRSGQLDINNSFPSRQYAWLKANMPDAVKVSPWLGVNYIAFHTRHPPTNDWRVRRALSLAIPREAITDKLLNYGLVPAYSFVPLGIANYPQPAELDFKSWPWEKRLAEARRLLAEAGYGPQHPLKIVFSYNTDKDMKKIALAAADGWRQIGVKTELFNSEGKVHYNDLKVANFQAARAAWVADYNDAENFLFLMDSRTGALNYSRYVNPAFDRLMTTASQTLDLDKRADLLRQAEAIAMRDAPVTPIYYYAARNLVQPWVKGWYANINDAHLTRYMRIEGRP